ncbi:unnamed protein product, partial [Sphacelaria rigidula]
RVTSAPQWDRPPSAGVSSSTYRCADCFHSFAGWDTIPPEKNGKTLPVHELCLVIGTLICSGDPFAVFVRYGGSHAPSVGASWGTLEFADWFHFPCLIRYEPPKERKCVSGVADARDVGFM